MLPEFRSLKTTRVVDRAGLNKDVKQAETTYTNLDFRARNIEAETDVDAFQSVDLSATIWER